MSGYKRVNFYELCRLCASNQQKEKTHIFQEEGRKIQLQTKIQSCLSLKVCENDFLPKVVCSECLQCLEECYVFRKECHTSETMLSSYFNNFRYTEDFKKSGKVYIKDTSPKLTTAGQVTQEMPQTIIQTAPTNFGSNVCNENIPSYYTIQLPTLLAGGGEAKQQKIEVKVPSVGNNTSNTPQLALNLNNINFTALKNALNNSQKTCLFDMFNNVTINSSGEIISLLPIATDLDTIVSTACTASSRSKSSDSKHAIQMKRRKLGEGKLCNNHEIGQIYLTQGKTEAGIYSKTSAHRTTVPINKMIVTAMAEEKINACNDIIYQQMQDNGAMTAPKSLAAHFGNYNSNQESQGIPSIPCSSRPELQSNVPEGTIGVPVTNNDITNYQELQLKDGKNYHQMHASEDHSILPERSKSDLTAEGIDYLQYGNFIGDSYHLQNRAVVAPSVYNSVLNSCCTTTTTTTTTATTTTTTTTTTNVPNYPNEHQQQTKVHSCNICNKTFKRREHLYQHVKLHTGFRPFRCENCNKAFMRKEHLLRHKTSHSGQKNYTCSICEKSFSRNDNLLKHKKTHDKQTSFTCDICQKQFVMKHYYIAHKSTHENEKCTINPVWNLLKA